MPKDDGEFYQFVYISNSKQIRGASIPFQFKRTHLSDFVEVEDQESVVIKSKESAINDTITEIKSRCAHLSNVNKYKTIPCPTLQQKNLFIFKPFFRLMKPMRN